MLGAVMHRVESPQKTDAMLKAMSPVDEQVAQEDDLDRLQPPWLIRDAGAKTRRHDDVQPAAKPPEQPEHQPGPQQVLAGEEAEVGEPVGPQEFLPGPCGKRQLEWAEDHHEEEEA